MKLAEICDLIDGELIGSGDTEITGVSGIKEAQEGDITFLANSRYKSQIYRTAASAIIVGKDINETFDKPIIKVEAPFYSFAKVLEFFAPKERIFEPGIDPSAIIGENAQIDENAVIRPYVYIGSNVKIGKGTIIHPFVYIGDDVEIGSRTVIYPNVTIRERCRIGSGVIIHSGVRIGTDGFGFAKVSDRHHKIPQIGTVIIEDDVEIGANTTIDRATMTNRATIIRKGTKIDNLVQIAHNVSVGENCLITAQVGIAGSTQIGNWVTFAGQSGSVGHVRIGDNVTVAARAGVTKDIESGQFISGFPAEPHNTELRRQAALRKVPDLISQVRALEGKVADLEAKLARLLEEKGSES